MEQRAVTWAKKQIGARCRASKSAYGDQSVVYRLDAPRISYFLKIGSQLMPECERLKWLDQRLPVPKVLAFTRIENRDALLLSSIEGANLAELSKKWTADRVIAGLVKALHAFHGVDGRDCPFGKKRPKNVLVHGDACLPNFIFHDNAFAGYIDLGDMRLDRPEVDLSAAVWSLQYNLGPGTHGLTFLQAYGVKNATQDLVEKLRLQYNRAQRAWGL